MIQFIPIAFLDNQRYRISTVQTQQYVVELVVTTSLCATPRL